jgi:G8 domain
MTFHCVESTASDPGNDLLELVYLRAMALPDTLGTVSVLQRALTIESMVEYLVGPTRPTKSYLLDSQNHTIPSLQFRPLQIVHTLQVILSSSFLQLIMKYTAVTNALRFSLLLAAFANGSPTLRGSGGVMEPKTRQLQYEIPPFVALSCNKNLANVRCQSFISRFGTGSIKDSLVTIPCGECYNMDHRFAMVMFRKGLDIQGRLVFPEGYSVHVVSPLIVVQGELVIRAATKPINGTEQVRFTLIGEDEKQTFTPIGDNANKCTGRNATCEIGKKAFVVAGGKIDVKGIPSNTPTWGLLHDMIGTDTIVLDSATNWAAGAQILITSHTQEWNKHQVRTIRQVSRLANGKVSLKLNQTIVRPTTVLEDARFATEVALLSRNVLIQGGIDSNPWHGGHFVVDRTPNEIQWIEGVEFRNMGQQGKLGRYPIHFHFCDDSSRSVVAKNTIRRSNQRCVVVHGTDKLEIRENVAYDTKGHCFMLEDGLEENNRFIRNLGAQTGAPLTVIAEYEFNGVESDGEPATFWITNPTNYFSGNVAAGSENSGYWFEPQLRGERAHLYPDKEPMYAPLGTFENNVAHSNIGKTVSDTKHRFAPNDRQLTNIFFYTGCHSNVRSRLSSTNAGPVRRNQVIP